MLRYATWPEIVGVRLEVGQGDAAGLVELLGREVGIARALERAGEDRRQVLAEALGLEPDAVVPREPVDDGGEPLDLAREVVAAAGRAAAVEQGRRQRRDPAVAGRLEPQTPGPDQPAADDWDRGVGARDHPQAAAQAHVPGPPLVLGRLAPLGLGHPLAHVLELLGDRLGLLGRGPLARDQQGQGHAIAAQEPRAALADPLGRQPSEDLEVLVLGPEPTRGRREVADRVGLALDRLAPVDQRALQQRPGPGQLLGLEREPSERVDLVEQGLAGGQRRLGVGLRADHEGPAGGAAHVAGVDVRDQAGASAGPDGEPRGLALAERDRGDVERDPVGVERRAADPAEPEIDLLDVVTNHADLRGGQRRGPAGPARAGPAREVAEQPLGRLGNGLHRDRPGHDQDDPLAAILAVLPGSQAGGGQGPDLVLLAQHRPGVGVLAVEIGHHQLYAAGGRIVGVLADLLEHDLLLPGEDLGIPLAADHRGHQDLEHLGHRVGRERSRERPSRRAR